ncbi:MAG TPA: transposase [Acidobacteriaceae bacterium]
MAMGRREKRRRQEALWVAHTELPKSVAHPFYLELNRLLEGNGFDLFVERQCTRFYAAKMGRPSLPPGIYFRLLLIGYFEGLDSERGIAWRAADSLALRSFISVALDEQTPDHSTISRTRRLIDLETHEQVFGWVLERVAEAGLLKGKTIGIDATTLEANAALRSIVRRDSGTSYEEFLTALAQASGIATPTRDDLARLDRERKGKGGNEEWVHPQDPDACITKMKDGRTHLAHKAEHAVDMTTGAIVAVTLQPANTGDTQTIMDTVATAGEALVHVIAQPEVGATVSPDIIQEIVADKGYHSNTVLQQLQDAQVRTYISEPHRRKRRWKTNPEDRDRVYANRRRISGHRGRALLRCRGELLERSLTHLYDTGGMRRTHLRRHNNILKRLVVHASAFNLGLVLRHRFGVGKPRRLQGTHERLALLIGLYAAAGDSWLILSAFFDLQ